MPTKLEKLEAHASHLLDAFIALRERYAMLHPMLFKADVPIKHGAGIQGRGFLILRHSLFLSCAQDIAKLVLDSDARTPSIKNLLSELADPTVRCHFREQFSLWQMPSAEKETDPEIVAALRNFETLEEAERRVQFDGFYSEACSLLSALSHSSALHGFLTIRDKVSAHAEVRFVADKYQFVDISTLGIKWSDIGATIDGMQRLVELIGLLIRNAGFAWETLDEQLARAGNDFWH